MEQENTIRLVNLFQQDFVPVEQVCSTAQKNPSGFRIVNPAKNISGGYGVCIEHEKPPCTDLACLVHGNILEVYYQNLKQQKEKNTKT